MFAPRPIIEILPNVTDDTVVVGELKAYVAELLRDVPDDVTASLGSNGAESLARGLLALESWARGFRKKTDESQ